MNSPQAIVQIACARSKVFLENESIFRNFYTKHYRGTYGQNFLVTLSLFNAYRRTHSHHTLKPRLSPTFQGLRHDNRCLSGNFMSFLFVSNLAFKVMSVDNWNELFVLETGCHQYRRTYKVETSYHVFHFISLTIKKKWY